MAVARASSAFGAPAAGAQQSGGGGEEAAGEEALEQWGEAALVVSLTALRRVAAVLPDAAGQQDVLDSLQLNLAQVRPSPLTYIPDATYWTKFGKPLQTCDLNALLQLS